MVDKPTQSEFSSPAGFLLQDSTRRGISEGSTMPVTYKDAAIYREGITDDLGISGSLDMRNSFQSQQALQLAAQIKAGRTYIQGPNFNDWPMVLDYGQHINYAYSRYEIDKTGAAADLWHQGSTTYNSAIVSTVGGITYSDPSSTTGSGIRMTSGGSSGDYVRVASTAANGGAKVQYILLYTSYWATTSTIADMRLWAGLSSDYTLWPGTDTGAAGHYFIAFHANTASNANIQIMTSANGTDTTTNTDVAWAANTKYRFDIALIDGVPTFRINGVTVGTHTSNVPPDNTYLWHASLFQTTAAAAKAMDHWSDLMIWK